jgi:hypothetical protein
LIDALVEVRNEETHLHDAGLLQSFAVLDARSLAGRSSSARPAAAVPLASHPVVPPAARGESIGLHCDHSGRDGHVEEFYYRKKKAQKDQARRSSQGTGSGESKKSSADSETQEILLLLHHLATSTSAGAVDSVTRSSALIGSTTSQYSTSGPPSAPSPGTCSWYLDSGVSFYMTPHYVHFSSMRPSYRHLTIQTIDGSPLSVARQGTLCSDSFLCP